MDKVQRQMLDERVVETLLAGQVVTAELVTEVGIEVPIAEACRQWLSNVIRQAVHRVGERLELQVMSLGPGRGHKLIQTAEEVRQAFLYALARVKGDARRFRALGNRLKRLAEMGQLMFNFDALVVEALREGGIPVGLEGAPQSAQAASA